jgi:hypothetical protein
MPCRYRLEGKLAPVALTNSSAEKCSTSFSTDIAVLPSLTKGEPARLIRLSDPTCPFHASPLGLLTECSFRKESVAMGRVMIDFGRFAQLCGHWANQAQRQQPPGRS